MLNALVAKQPQVDAAVAPRPLPVFDPANRITPATFAEFWVGMENIYPALLATLPPLEIINFTEVAPQRVVAPDARPFAVLNEATTQSAEVVLVSFGADYDVAQHRLVSDTGEPLPDDQGAFTILATIKYQLPKGVVLVSTTRPSNAATKHKLYLGNQAITLANGTPAWTTMVETANSDGTLLTEANQELYFPNQIIWVQGDLLITVASPLPLERVQELAAQVVMK